MRIYLDDLDYRESHHLGVCALVPRPVVLVSTIGEDGVFNVAPFSTINRVSMKPLLMGFEVGNRRDGQEKDTLRNIRSTKEFVINIVDEDLAVAMNIASADFPSDVDEFKEARLTPVEAGVVKAPMVGESPITLECSLLEILRFGEAPRYCNFIIGKVILAHIRDDLYVNGDIYSTRLRPIARLEPGHVYCRVTDTFELETIHRRE